MHIQSMFSSEKFPRHHLKALWSYLVLFAVTFIHADIVQADGLIFQLPPDGAWCEFSGETVSEINIELPANMAGKLTKEAKKQFDKMSGPRRHQETIRLSSVGSETRAQRPCRWIELSRKGKVLESENEQSSPGEAAKGNALKLLVPERYLVRGEDAFENAVLTLWNPKEIDVKKVELEKGFNRIQYEIDRFRPVFPPLLKSMKMLPAVTINTPVGEFQNCEVISGTSRFDKPTLGDGRWEFEFEWELALHADAPFGVVRIQCKSTGKEISRNLVTHIKMQYVHTLSKVGKGATSSL